MEDDDGDSDNGAPTVQLAPPASPPASAVPSSQLSTWGSSRSSSAHRSQEIKTPTELFASGPALSTTPGQMEHQAASQHPPMLV